ncbi:MULTISPECIES: hypothetical protein [unclassified Streptomyces]|uniref:hypothetical protein n=1 Tax=unclassified Streptomyces TaxID=2593676 RepID=UPI001F0356D1|nr:MULTISPECIES: hypothetical protein [unclassified Streptomyces]MCH0563796.1 hypothetical protein [Streptomyces sp. MUM 2J]MCH0570082.1 hypothetical protein [Streptomyces sp. MUM 136J]
MRRTTFRRTTAAAVTAAALSLVACGTQDGTGTSGSGSPSAFSPTSSAPSPSATPGDGCVRHVQLTEDDDGATVCLVRGGDVRLTLDGTSERPWSPVEASGDVLEPVNAGIVILPGDAVAAFRAVAPGTARLTSARPVCASQSQHAHCHALRSWSVTVTVR